MRLGIISETAFKWIVQTAERCGESNYFIIPRCFIVMKILSLKNP